MRKATNVKYVQNFENIIWLLLKSVPWNIVDYNLENYKTIACTCKRKTIMCGKCESFLPGQIGDRR